MEILYNCKIIESNNIYSNIKISVFPYQNLANYLNLINANYFIYYYIFNKGNIIKLSRFNYYQLPIFKESKPIEFQNTYYSPEKSDMIIEDSDDSYLNISSGAESQPSKTQIIYNYGLINELYTNFMNKNKNKKINIKIFNKNDNEFIYLKNLKLPQSLYNHINLFFKYSMKQLFKDLLRCFKNPSTSVNYIITNCDELIKFSDAIEQQLDYQIPEEQKKPIAYNILFKVIEDFFINKCMQYINVASIKLYNKFISKTSSTSIPLPLPLPLPLPSPSDDISNFSYDVNSLISIIKTDELLDQKDLKNKENLIIHCNFSNLNIIKNKYTIYINTDIINDILENNIDLSLENINDNTCIYSLLEYYTNDTLLRKIFDEYNFNEFEDNKPLNYIKKELENLKFKLYENINYDDLTNDNFLDDLNNVHYKEEVEEPKQKIKDVKPNKKESKFNTANI